MAVQDLRKQSQNIDQTIPRVPISNLEPKSKKLPTLINVFWSHFTVTAIPFFLNLTIIHLFGSGQRYRGQAKPCWFPSLTLIHLANMGSAILMGQAAWLVWLDGGLNLDSDALPLYIAQVSLSIVWDPLVLRVGAAWLGFGFCLLNLGTLCACHWMFGKVNRSSMNFVTPCLAWGAYLTLVTLKLGCL